ncbi:hypothetical protein P5V15_014727 [Pogonomyrmex californicus]
MEVVTLHGQLGPLERKYVGDDIDKMIDNMYDIYFDKSGTMLGDKKFDVDKNDSIIIDNVRYNGTSELYELYELYKLYELYELYELIFKRLPDEAIFRK